MSSSSYWKNKALDAVERHVYPVIDKKVELEAEVKLLKLALKKASTEIEKLKMWYEYWECNGKYVHPDFIKEASAEITKENMAKLASEGPEIPDDIRKKMNDDRKKAEWAHSGQEDL